MLISNYIYFTECSKTHALVQKKARGKVRDLTGPKKIRLFQNMNIPTLFPALQQKQHL